MGQQARLPFKGCSDPGHVARAEGLRRSPFLALDAWRRADVRRFVVRREADQAKIRRMLSDPMSWVFRTRIWILRSGYLEYRKSVGSFSFLLDHFAYD